MTWLFRYLPLSYLSWFVGKLINLPLPQPLARWSVVVFAWLYKIDITQASKALGDYRCIGEFFTRDLVQRPIAAKSVEEGAGALGLLSPVDGKLRAYQELSPGLAIPQVKGREYTLKQLLAEDPLVTRLENGALWNMYLSPSDAHHIFAPVAGRIVRTVQIPGKLWPVNDWALHSVDGLFAVNERVVTYIESAVGLVAVVMIGATNVGRIALKYTPLETNTKPWRVKPVTAIDHTDISVLAGEKIGTFKMGSSVIVITEWRPLINTKVIDPHVVRYGEVLV